jgi:hypothetical protein
MLSPVDCGAYKMDLYHSDHAYSLKLAKLLQG